MAKILFIPNLTGRVDPLAEQAIRELYRMVYAIKPGGTTVVNNTTQEGAKTTVLVSTSGGGGGGGGGSTILSLIQDFTLVAATTTNLVPTSPTTTGDLLGVWVKAKGKTALFTWGPGIKHAPVSLDWTTDTWTPFQFKARIDPNDGTLKWFYVGPQPVAGQA